MNKYSIFSGLNSDETAQIEACLHFESKCFRRGETILSFSQDSSEAGIVRSGLAYLISINDAGEENILDYYEEGNIFGSFLSTDTNVKLYSVVAKKN